MGKLTWYQALIKPLLVKIKPEEQQDADYFLEKIFTIAHLTLQQPTWSCEFLLGIIDKLYRYCGPTNDGDLPLSEFSQFFFAAMVVYAKHAEDQALWNSNFVAIVKHRCVYKAFGLNISGNKAIVKLINQLEFTFLQYIDYRAKVDLSYIKTIFFDNYSVVLINDFLADMKPFIKMERSFDDFLKSISTEKRRIETHSLMCSIRQLNDHGSEILFKDKQKSVIIRALVDQLIKKAAALLYRSYQPSANATQLAALKADFLILLHSQDAAMSRHRSIWKPIAANIAIALTGVGGVAIMGNAICSKLKHKRLTLNDALFFSQTCSQQKVDNIEGAFNHHVLRASL